MNAKKFVDEIASLSPPMSALADLGLTNLEAEEFGSMYIAQLSQNNVKYDDPILELINNYDCSKLDIAGIQFIQGFNNSGFLSVAELDTDIIAIQISNQSIVLLEGENQTHIMSMCAVDGAYFLDALLTVADFSSKRIFDDKMDTNQDLILEIAKECERKSGNNSSLGFYLTLLGYDPE